MLLLSLAIVAAAEGAGPVTAPAPPMCQDMKQKSADGRPHAGVHKLGKEPPAQHVFAVLRTEDGCSRPVPVNEQRASPPPR